MVSLSKPRSSIGNYQLTSSSTPMKGMHPPRLSLPAGAVLDRRTQVRVSESPQASPIIFTDILPCSKGSHRSSKVVKPSRLSVESALSSKRGKMVNQTRGWEINGACFENTFLKNMLIVLLLLFLFFIAHGCEPIREFQWKANPCLGL